jgi:hypothetical protein
MSNPDAARLAALLEQIDRLCADAAKIRRKLTTLNAEPTFWPERRGAQRLLDELSEADNLAPPPSSKRRK